MGIILDSSQATACTAIKGWFSSAQDPIFVLAGLAGTGKSTIVNYFIDDLKIRPHEVAFCAYTGKAALVLRRKGLPASTIHSLIYDPQWDEETQEFTFTKKTQLASSLKLIVVDEASMVGSEIQEDLESYGIPIIYVGDHGQLPPVGDAYANILQNANCRLEQIHRQAENNPIIRAAMLARRGSKIPVCNMGEEFKKIRKIEVTDELLLSVDQVLCGKNATRLNLNDRIKTALGKKPRQLEGGDKVICLKNNRKNLLINGLIGWVGQVEEVLTAKEHYYLASFRDEEDKEYFSSENKYPLYVGKGEGKQKAVKMQAPVFLGEKPLMNDPWRREPFDFGYAITVHKSQGSQFPSILIYEEWLGDSSVHKTWLYTAITRASEKVILAG